MNLPSMYPALALPTEPASIFTMILIVAAVFAVIWFGRTRPE